MSPEAVIDMIFYVAVMAVLAVVGWALAPGPVDPTSIVRKRRGPFDLGCEYCGDINLGATRCDKCGAWRG